MKMQKQSKSRSLKVKEEYFPKPKLIKLKKSEIDGALLEKLVAARKIKRQDLINI